LNIFASPGNGNCAGVSSLKQEDRANRITPEITAFTVNNIGPRIFISVFSFSISSQSKFKTRIDSKSFSYYTVIFD
jgi:hypothetical protein